MFDRPSGAASDPLAGVLSLVDARCEFSAEFRTGGAWAVRFAPPEGGVKFGVVLRGGCELAVDGLAFRRLETGDCYLLTRGLPYVLASDLELPPVAFGVNPSNDETLQWGRDDDVRIAGGRFVFEGVGASLVLGVPAVLHVPAGTEAAGVLPWISSGYERSSGRAIRAARG